MTEDLNPKTLDLVGVLSGRDYPTLDVKVHFNETLGLELKRVRDELEKTDDNDAVIELESELSELEAQRDAEEYVVTLKAVPESVRRRISEKIQEDFPEETDLLGRARPNPGADTAFAVEMWKAYIRTVSGPDGSSKVVDEADINALRSNAPDLAQEKITRGITELQTGSSMGFEGTAKGIDFLSQA